MAKNGGFTALSSGGRPARRLERSKYYDRCNDRREGLSIEKPQFSDHPGDTDVQLFDLAKQRKIKVVELEEYIGFELPRFSGRFCAVEHVNTESLRETVVSMLRAFCKSSAYIKLQSVFTVTNGTTSIAGTYKFSWSKLNLRVQKRDYLIYRSGAFRIMQDSRLGRSYWRKLRQPNQSKARPKKVTAKRPGDHIQNRLKELLAS